jgi:TusA-related sulfurtransferase
MIRLDLRNGVTPFALLEVVRFFKGMEPGETLEIIGNDQDLRQDLSRILPAGCLRVVAADGAEEYVACIRKPASR